MEKENVSISRLIRSVLLVKSTVVDKSTNKKLIPSRQHAQYSVSERWLRVIHVFLSS